MKQKYLKIEGENSFIKDATNGALINTDNQALLAYRKNKKARTKTENDIENLKNEMSEIKQMLLKLLDK